VDEPFPPIVDLRSSTASAEIDRACSEVGFFQVLGHGIPQDLISQVFAQIDDFFTLDVEEKTRWESAVRVVDRGYAAKGSEGFGYTVGVEQPPDLFESYSIGLEPLPNRPAFHTDAHTLFAPNIWPDRPQGLREVMLAYYAQADRVAHLVNRLMAIALGIDADFFESYTDASTDMLRLNFFEGRPGDSALPNQFGIGAHTDYGICTILLADQEPALQVFTKEGEWRYAVPVEGALLVNVGDLLARWTNDRWRSTLHRVMPVLSAAGEVRRRRSIPFFHEGNHDARIECLPTCTGPDNPPRYAPITGGEPCTRSRSRAASSTPLTQSRPSVTVLKPSSEAHRYAQ
jgi:isopenicillin N synthase-like dioxygenase